MESRSLPARGARVEIMCLVNGSRDVLSLPARGARVEIVSVDIDVRDVGGRSPQGERGLKSLPDRDRLLPPRRSPQGERGLKFDDGGRLGVANQSLPARGARVEAGGCTEMQHVLDIFGENGFGLKVNILIDEDDGRNLEKLANRLEVTVDNLAEKSVFVSRKDLEDEYVSAIGADRLWSAMSDSSLFTRNMLSNCKIASGASVPNEQDLAEYCRSNKIISAVVACGTFDKETAEKVSSVAEVLRNAS